MKFQVGDWVYPNPNYFPSVDTVRGVITAETAPYNKELHYIDWEDGRRGNVYLNTKHTYLLKV